MKLPENITKRQALVWASVLAAVLVVAGLSAIFWPFKAKISSAISTYSQVSENVAIVPQDRLVAVMIPEQTTFSKLMEEQGVGASVGQAIYTASKKVYDLAKIRAGWTLELLYAPDETLKELTYNINYEEELHVRFALDGWKATLEKIQYDIQLKTVQGTVDSSLYEAGLAQGVDERAIIAMADVFDWTIDFAQDVRAGDTFSFVYEELWRDGRYIMPGSVIAVRYTNAGHEFSGYRFEDSKGKVSYFDEEGKSLRRLFLKAPVAFKFISSGYTTGLRYVSAFNVSTGHRAVDYAAKSGTPIRATADGVVIYAGWNGPYGNFVSIRHNATYTTNYGHQSKIAVKKGQRVVQGQVIGYVGSTGFSTGPHLHYEMVKNGVKINPLKETFASTEPVPKSEKEAFDLVVALWQDKF
ncbi:MAG: peptidoglycan DD-metalloendopeptidase family protein [bacterium]